MQRAKTVLAHLAAAHVPESSLEMRPTAAAIADTDVVRGGAGA